MLKNPDCKEWFVKSGKEMLTNLLKKAKYVSFILFFFILSFKNHPLQSSITVNLP